MKPAPFLTILVGATIIILNTLFMRDLRVADGVKVIEYKDFAAILLTAVAVIVAVLAIGLAILAVFGYRDLMERAENKAHVSASAVARAAADSHLKSPEFNDAVRQAIDEIRREQMQSRLNP